jgi:hypothetical protein
MRDPHELERALDIGVVADADGRIPLYGDHYDDTYSAWRRAYAPLSCVAQSNPALPTSTILAYAAKVAGEMDRMLAAGADREWGIPLAAEAMFNLVTKHKDPLPKHIVSVEPGTEVHVPALIAPLLGQTNSEVRRLLKAGAVKLGDKRFVMGIDVPADSLIDQTVIVGKQGLAILVVST